MSTTCINRFFAACLLLGLPLSSAHAAPQVRSGALPSPAKRDQTKPAPVSTKNRVTFGDVQITDFDKNTITDNFTKFTYTVRDPSKGGVKVESTDNKRGTHMVVIADEVVGTQQQKGHEVVRFTGHVHYTITEKSLKKVGGGTRPVERIVTGTAQRAVYTAFNKKLHLSNEVDAKLVDPDQFDGPATLHVDDLTMENTMANESRYLLKGDTNTTDIRFTPHVEPAPPLPAAVSKSVPKPNAKKKGASPSSGIGTVHVSHFASSTLNVGQNMSFDGSLVTIETVNNAEKTQNILKAPHITANLIKEHQSIQALGGIHFDSRSTLVKDAKNITQILAGTAEQATWKQDKSLEVDGSIEATLTNPDRLMEPATLSAAHLKATPGDSPKYVVTGVQEKTRLALWPRARVTHTEDTKSEEGSKDLQTTRTTVDLQTVPTGKINTQNNRTEQKPGRRSDQEAINKDVSKDADEDALDSSKQTASARSTPFAFGKIVVTKFQTATYEPDKSLIVEGTKVDFISTDTISNSLAELQTPRFEADFDATNSTINVVRATKNVSYRFQQLHKTGTNLQTMTGKGRAVTFTNTFTNGQQSQIVKVEGVGDSNIVNQDGKGIHLKLLEADSEAWQVYDLITHDYHMENPLKQTALKVDPEFLPAKSADTSNPTAKKTKKKK